MSNDSGSRPFHAWIPIASVGENESALELSSDGESVELIFVNSAGRGTVHRLSRDDFARLLSLVASRLGLSAPSDVR